MWRLPTLCQPLRQDVDTQVYCTSPSTCHWIYFTLTPCYGKGNPSSNPNPTHDPSVFLVNVINIWNNICNLTSQVILLVSQWNTVGNLCWKLWRVNWKRGCNLHVRPWVELTTPTPLPSPDPAMQTLVGEVVVAVNKDLSESYSHVKRAYYIY